MPRTAITPVVPPGPRPTLPLPALSAALPMVAVDAVNFNQTPCTGRELLFFSNPSGGALTVTVTSVPDPQNRTGDITTYSIPAAGFAVLGPFSTVGWKQPDGNLYFTGSGAALLVGVVQVPAGTVN